METVEYSAVERVLLVIAKKRVHAMEQELVIAKVVCSMEQVIVIAKIEFMRYFQQ
jgi:hypothetical protein